MAIIPVSVPGLFPKGSIEKEKLHDEKSQKVDSETLGCVQVRRTAELGADVQKTYIDTSEEGRPEKRETKNGLIPPDDQSDDRRDAQ